LISLRALLQGPARGKVGSESRDLEKGVDANSIIIRCDAVE
jgi:hypothetical protein